jgi:hypothetical protein
VVAPTLTPPGQPLCAEAVRYYGDNLGGAGISDPNVTGLRTSREQLLAGFTSVIAAYDAAHPGVPVHASVSSAGGTMGAINWLWEVGGLSSKVWGIRTLVGNAPTSGYVTHTEQRLAQKIGMSTHPLSPAEVFALALDLNNGDATNALLAAHNTLRALGRGDLVDQELTNVLPNAALYGTHLADLRTGGENAGPWYHLFGTAYFELVSSETGYGAQAAQAAAFGAEDAPAGASVLGVAADRLTGELPAASSLSGWANWAEQRVRAHNGSRPDPEKYCVNVWGAQLGAVLAQGLGGTAPVTASQVLDSTSGSEIDVLQSPYSVQWVTPQGTTTIDQKTGMVSFGSPLVVYPLAEPTGWGAVFVPPAHTDGTLTFVATTAGADLHFLRVDTASGQVVLYRATAGTAGQTMTLPLGDAAFGQAMTASDGTSITPQHLTLSTPSPWPDRSGDATAVALKLSGALAVVTAAGIGGALLLARRRRNAAPPHT